MPVASRPRTGRKTAGAGRAVVRLAAADDPRRLPPAHDLRPAALLGTLFLAWSNGANDNFKGVATLYGSATAGFRKSLLWASLTTALGSLVSVSLAGALARQLQRQGADPGPPSTPRR